jgi:hypothetical protein
VRVRWWLAVVVVGVTAAFVPDLVRLLGSTLLRPGVTKANFEWIAVGMQQRQVEALLGGPPGYYSQRDPTRMNCNNGYGSLAPPGRVARTEAWWGDTGIVLVQFDATGSVVGKGFNEMWRPEPPPFLDRLRAALGL